MVDGFRGGRARHGPRSADLHAGRQVDSFTRECLALEVDSCLFSRCVARVLDWVIAQRAAPEAIRCDNGPEFTSRHCLAWCEERQIKPVHIKPGRPMQNGYVESFNGRFPDECLNANWFATMADARQKIEAWRQDYNEDAFSSVRSSTRELTPLLVKAAIG